MVWSRVKPVPFKILCNSMEILSVNVGKNEENICKVVSNEGGRYLTVSYLSPSEKNYKGTKVYSFEKEVEYLDLDKITKRYSSMEELGFVKLQDNMFVEKEDIDEESSSEIETDSEEYDYDSDGFIVPDDQDVMQKPPDHKEVDREWNNWRPMTPGAKRFKEHVDRIEAYMNHQIDEKFVFQK